MAYPVTPTGSSRTKGMLLGLGYGAILAQHDDPRQSSLSPEKEIPHSSCESDWIDLVCAQADAIDTKTGFDGATVASELVDVISRKKDTSLPREAKSSLSRIAAGDPWYTASSKRTQRALNFEPLVRNCILAPAFLSFPDELEYVTHRSTLITSNSTDVMKASATLTALLAELIVHDSDEQQLELLGGLHRGFALKRDNRLRSDLKNIEDSVKNVRDNDRDIGDIKYFQKEEGSVRFFIRAVLLAGFGTDDIESAVHTAQRSKFHPEILTPLVGAIMGARFGVEALPDEWADTVGDTNQLMQSGRRMLLVDERRSAVPSHEQVPLIHGRPIVGSTYLRRRNRYQKAEMLRPEPAPHTYPGTLSRHLTPSQATFFDWEHRAHRGLKDAPNAAVLGDWIRVPEYALEDKIGGLPEQDMERLQGIARRACDFAKEAIELYEDTWDRTLNNDLLGEEGSDRIGSHLGYMIRSINWPLNELGDQLSPKKLLQSWNTVVDATRILVKLEDYMSVTADLMLWSERDWEHYSTLVPRILFATGSVRQALEAMRGLVIRHPEYEHDTWVREGTVSIEL